MHDLRQPEDAVVETVVVAMHEHQHTPVGAGDVGADRLLEFLGVAIEHRALGGEMLGGVALPATSGPLDLADFMDLRHGDVDARILRV